ncbi:alpha/beta fold hydrolase, partial [Streptomyces tendae]
RLGRLLDALELDSVNLAGHDYGGFLALGFTETKARIPQGIRAFVMCERMYRWTRRPRRQGELGRSVFDLSPCGHVDKTLK